LRLNIAARQCAGHVLGKASAAFPFQKYQTQACPENEGFLDFD